MLFRGQQQQRAGGEEQMDPSSSSSRQRRPQQAAADDTFEVPPIPAGSSSREPHQRHGGREAAAGAQQQQQQSAVATASSTSSTRQRFGALRGRLSGSTGNTSSANGSGGGGGSRTAAKSSSTLLSSSAATTALPTTTQSFYSSRYRRNHSHGNNLKSNLANVRVQWSKLSPAQRLAWTAFLALCIVTVSLESVTLIRGRRRARSDILRAEEERKRRMLGLGRGRRTNNRGIMSGIGGGGDGDGDDSISLQQKRGIVQWELANTGRDPSRDRLVQWWIDHPDAPVGLSCAAFDAALEEEDDDNDDEAEDGDESPYTDVSSDGFKARARAVGGTSVKRKLVEPRSNRVISSTKAKGKTATPSAVTVKTVDDTYFYKGYGIAPPIFKGRMPETGSQRVQVAFVLPFVEFQLVKVATLLSEHWGKFPPCHQNSSRQSADLVFFTENKLSPSIQRRIRSYYSELGSSKTGCFRTDEPTFLSMADVDPKLSHLEGAAFSFFSLFRLLEKSYKTFILAEPDVAPVQPNFLPALVKKTLTVNCEADGFWQVGSIPLAKDVDAGMLAERLDYHMNGNAIYVLGCPEFEEYKCRVQTFYVPKDDCELVAGCSTHEAYEGGYDHALYRFRMHPENYEYSRLILHKFGYSDFVQNRGEGLYNPADVVAQSPTTYFIHSKSIYQNAAATTLKEVTVSVLKRDPCNRDSATEKALQKIYHNLRSGEYSKADAIRDLCDASKYKIFGPQASPRLCEMYAGTYTSQDWQHRMPGKTYLWTMDFHGGPANCDMSIITKAGGAVHAEIDGICDFYGLCKKRLKVIKADNWKEFDPTDQQKKDFQLAYQDDPEFKRVDAFICHHPVANCELFLPFNRSIIIHATTRLEFGRHDEGIDWRLSSGYDRDVGKEKWKKWIRTLQKLSADNRNVIAANNVYDRDYIKYFTGIENVELLPSWCGDNVGTKFCEDGWESSLSQGWLPTRPEVVIVPYRSNLDRTRYKTGIRDPVDHPIIKELSAVPKAISNGTDVKMIRELYSDANPLRMLKHPAIIILPYQISTIQLVELYRLNIPTFCPSLSLLKRWCREHDLMWEVHYGWPENLMGVTDIPNPNGHALMDKYSKEWEEMFDYWIPKSDFYQFDFITYFDSWEHFHRQYKIMAQKGELEDINRKMTKANAELRENLIAQWKKILPRVKRH